MKFSISFLMAIVIAALTGCGAGSGIATGTGAASGVAATPTAASIQLLASNPQMQSSATASTALTAVVLDANGQALTGQTVNFSRGSDNSAYFSNIATSGVATTATLNIGTNMADRVISISATAGNAVGTNTVTVSGTTIAISGNTSMALNASSTLTIIVKDSTGAPVPGVTLTVASQNGNPIVLAPTTGITSSTGQITATVTANNAGSGSDILTVSGAGAVQKQTLTINSASFAFYAVSGNIVTPSTTPEILVNTSPQVSVFWTNGGTPVSGQAVNFYTSRGTVIGSPATTNASGYATVNISAASTGATILTASGSNGTPAATLNVAFYTNTASSITAQANPSTVAVNSVGSTTNQSVISAIVRDSNQNLVQNAHVIFNQVTDPSGGSLATNTATTDITGTASVNYIPGSISSQQNGVQISVTVDSVNGTPVNVTPATVNLTVASQALFVRLGTDNVISSDTPIKGTYAKNYTALVTTSAGTPAPDGTLVTFIVRPVPSTWNGSSPWYGFFKGYYQWDTLVTPNVWDRVGITITPCASEDQNDTGIYSTALDSNGNGLLDPDGVVTVTESATTTSGFATATLTYAKSYATWVQVVLEATAGTIGNEQPTTATLILPAAAADYTSESPPAWATSPYGAGIGANAVCTNTK